MKLESILAIPFFFWGHGAIECVQRTKTISRVSLGMSKNHGATAILVPGRGERLAECFALDAFKRPMTRSVVVRTFLGGA